MKGIPGCEGTGEGRVDYCYLPDDITLPTKAPQGEINQFDGQAWNFLYDQSSTQETKPLPLNDEIRNCSEEEPCGVSHQGC